MIFTHERTGNIDIFNFEGELTCENKGELEAFLMKAIHGVNRVVLNFKKVTRIDGMCRRMLFAAYRASIRIKNPLIFNGVRMDTYGNTGLADVVVPNVSDDLKIKSNFAG